MNHSKICHFELEFSLYLCPKMCHKEATNLRGNNLNVYGHDNLEQVTYFSVPQFPHV